MPPQRRPRRPRPRKALTAGGALALAAVLCAAFGAQAAAPVSGQAPSAGDLFVSASIAEPSNLVPILASDSASQDVVGRVFNGLLKYNPELRLEGDLAESWEVLDEGRTIVFHLRRGVVWHDGADFTAEDVAFTYRKLVDAAVPTPYGGDFQKVQKLEVVDPHTVRVAYGEPFSPALSSWTMWIMPRHLLEGQDLTKTPFARSPVGTGPYRFRRWRDGDRVELAAFDRYFEHRPRIDGVVLRVIPDQTTAFLELHQESVDSIGLTPLQYLRLTDDAYFRAHFRKYRYPSLGYTYLGYNLRRPFFRDVRVRKALNLAVDKQEIIDGVLLGLGRVATGPFTPESWAYDPEVRPDPYDPDEARLLLGAAGWRDSDGDGVLDREGVPFAFTIVTNAGNFQRQTAAEIIQRRLGEIGITVKIKIVEWSAFLKEFIDQRDFDAVLLGWGLSLDPDPHDIWHSSKTKPGEFNFVSYRNAHVDALIEEGRRTFDPAERGRIYREVHRTLYDEQPYMFLFVPDALPILHHRFQGVRLTPLGLGYNFIDWTVPPDKRKYTRYVL
jgi:peptide/nickel transport system substrate-binding protein